MVTTSSSLPREVNDANAAAFDAWLAGSGYEIAERGAIYSDAKNYLLKRK